MNEHKFFRGIILLAVVFILIGMGVYSNNQVKGNGNGLKLISELTVDKIYKSEYSWDDEELNASCQTYEDSNYYYALDVKSNRIVEILNKQGSVLGNDIGEAHINDLKKQGLELFCKVQGIKQSENIRIDEYDNGAFYTFIFDELVDDIPTGANAIIAYYKNGNLLGAFFNYNDISASNNDNNASTDILSEEEAYQKVVEYIFIHSPKLVSFELIKDEEYDVSLETIRSVLVWGVNIKGKLTYSDGEEKIVSFCGVIDAYTGELPYWTEGIASNYGSNY